MSKLSLKCLNKFKFFWNWVLKFLGRDISRKGDMENEKLIYHARVITRARYTKNGIVWYIESGIVWYISLK